MWVQMHVECWPLLSMYANMNGRTMQRTRPEFDTQGSLSEKRIQEQEWNESKEEEEKKNIHKQNELSCQ